MKAKRYRAQLLVRHDDGRMFNLGFTTVRAKTRKEAKRLVIEELWDERLTASGCIPIIYFE